MDYHLCQNHQDQGSLITLTSSSLGPSKACMQPVRLSPHRTELHSQLPTTFSKLFAQISHKTPAFILQFNYQTLIKSFPPSTKNYANSSLTFSQYFPAKKLKIIIYITVIFRMKNYSLSTYQKQQYTQYLQTQLEKFSAFMLQQKKQNQKYRCLENIIDEQSQHIRKVDDRIRLLELYQRDNYRDSNDKCEKWRTSQFQSRLKRVESMYFQKSTQKENYDSNCAYGEINTLREELFKKIKVIEKDIKKISHQKQKHYKNNQNSPLCTAYSDVQSIHTNQNVATRQELKKMEDKLFSMFDKNFTRIERMIRKSVNRKIKNIQQKDQSTKTRKTREDILIQEHTFGNSKNQFNDYAIDHQNKSVAERSSVSETSGRLYPVKYFSEKQIQKENEKRKPRVKNQSRSKSLPREKSRSVKKSRSKSVSRSKSIKNERSHSKNSKKPAQKTQNSKLQKTPQKHSKQKSRDNLNLINQYKKMCKKKHF